jgi:nicotinate-nucleotide pyrophosphorylase (carboxylating)
VRPFDLDSATLPDLFEHLAELARLDRWLALVREEDLGPEGLDITSRICLDGAERARAKVVAREPGVISGLAALPRMVAAFGADAQVSNLVQDGDRIAARDTVATIEGRARDVLALERPLLNLVGRLSGVATRTRQFVEAMGVGHRAALYDTRKTTPGLRHLEKYAVRCGGGRCHRIGLYDAVLVKDNHIAALPMGSLAARVERISREARAERADNLRFVMVEVDTLDQLDQLLSLEPGVIDIVLLDNMDLDTLRRAVWMRDERRPDLQVEASGGVRLETIREIALTGIDRISVGSLTHQAVSLDLGLDAE